MSSAMESQQHNSAMPTTTNTTATKDSRPPTGDHLAVADLPDGGGGGGGRLLNDGVDKNKENEISSGKEKKNKKSKQEEKKAKKKDGSNKTSTNRTIIPKQDETNLVNGGMQPKTATALPNGNKPKSLVEELKLFQNNNLLNQQDPMQNLHLQLNQFINGDTINENSRMINTNHREPIKHSSSGVISQRSGNDRNGENRMGLMFEQGGASSTIKKGVLWQQQSYDKFHQRLFNRWKKRYFILTTDYLVCFKRSLSKVGHSEMGKFLYKTSLGDMLKVDWLKPNKSDKGPLILHLNGPFNLHLWSKDNLEEWMFMIEESIARYKARRSCTQQQLAARSDAGGGGGALKSTILGAPEEAVAAACKQQDAVGLYENTTDCRQANCTGNDSGRQQSANINSTTTAATTTTTTVDDGACKQAATQPASDGGSQRNSSSIKEGVESRVELGSPAAGPPTQAIVETGKGSSKSTATTSSCDSKEFSSIERELSGEGSRSQARRGIKKRHAAHEKEATDNSNAKQAQSNQGPEMAPVSGFGLVINDSLAPLCRASDGADEDAARNRVDRDKDDHDGDQQAKASDRLEGGRRQLEQADGRQHRRDEASHSSYPDQQQQHQQQLVAEADTDCSPEGGGRTRAGNETDLVGSREEAVAANIRRQASLSERSEVGRPGPPPLGEPERASSSSVVPAEAAADSSLLAREDRQQQQQQLLAPANSERPTTTAGPTNSDSRRQGAVGGPPSNLIRRDDSWQSLVSLTRVGKAPTAMQVAQRSLYAQHIMPHSFDAAAGAAAARGGTGLVESSVTPIRAGPFRQHSIQSSYSPSGQLTRKSRPFLQTGPASFDVPPSPSASQQQPPPPPSVSYQQKLLQLQLLHNSNNVDYIRHSNNVGGQQQAAQTRANGGDYQIYGPESTVYGYSSMRSNLKSAASEFSFIRPASSSHIQSTLPHPNSAHAAGGFGQQPAEVDADRRNAAAAFAQSASFRGQFPHQQHFQTSADGNNSGNPIGVDLPIAAAAATPIGVGLELIPPMRELPMKPNKRRPLNGDATSNNDCLGGGSGGHAKSLPKSSSLTTSIACFFRRAFSRRSKRRRNQDKRRSKLAESCSSSLAAFENENFARVPIVPSAFSTGSKSVDGRTTNETATLLQQNQFQPQPQQQRMVDMIEAFTSKNFANQAQPANGGNGSGSGAGNSYKLMIGESQRMVPISCASGRDAFLSDTRQQQRSSIAAPEPAHHGGHLGPLNSPKLTPARNSGCVRQNAAPNQSPFGASPLHKSNSISATMGLSSYVIDPNNNNLHTGKQRLVANNNLCYDNAEQLHHLSQRGGSPMMSRSAKVMSANLTPLREPMMNSSSSSNGQQRLFLSPARHDQHHMMPRPSSIYGQPSMIGGGGGGGGSPLMSRGDEPTTRLANNFGLQRNSMHGYNIKSKVAAAAQQGGGVPASELIRAQLMMKATYLSTTKEVAEEMSSPTRESSRIGGPLELERDLAGGQASRGHYASNSFNLITASPSNHNHHNSSGSARPTPQHRRAVVNPILQSPTMDTIYDNHPMLNGRAAAAAANSNSNSSSHYDNHNQLLMEQQQQQQQIRLIQQQQHGPLMGATAKQSNSMTQFYLGDCGGQQAPMHRESPYSERIFAAAAGGQSRTPSHQRGLITASISSSSSSKPAAIVAPSTPNHHHSMDYCESRHNHADHNSNYERSRFNESPLISRRTTATRNHAGYQQSPLFVNRSAPMGDGHSIGSSLHHQQQQPIYSSGGGGGPSLAVNIAGAPGINLDPALAASLLRGTNIDAYESSTATFVDRLSSSSSSGRGGDPSKTFLVSTRLSKSMAQNKSTVATGATCADSPSNSNGNTSLKSSKDEELSSSMTGSQSIHSAASSSSTSGSGSSTRRERLKQASNTAGHKHTGSRDDQLGGGDSSSMESNRSRLSKATEDGGGNRSSRKGSTTESSDGNSSSSPRLKAQAKRWSGSFDKDEQRNWITSKLVVDNKQ